MDDEEVVRSVAKEMLLHLGHEVVLSKDGVEAIKLYQEAIRSNKKFDLVIMDLTIPGGLGGKKAVREILNIDQAAKVQLPNAMPYTGRRVYTRKKLTEERKSR